MEGQWIDLIERQKELAAKIDSAAINFNKDSANRKTEEYIQKKLEAVDMIWCEFVGNDIKLAAANIKLPDFQRAEMYDSVKQRYEKLLQLLTSFNPNSKPSGTTTTERSALSKTDDLKYQQATNFRAFLRVVKGIDASKLTEKWELEDKLQMLQQRWKAVDNLHWQIDNVLMGSDLSYEQQYSEHEATYEAAKKLLNQKLSSTSHQLQSTPKIEIPTFTGNYTQWPTFMDLFTETIHNNPTLTKTQKMQHLKGKLKGEAERLVQHLYITADNYDTCWELLSYRYNNVQLLFTKQVQLLMNQPSIHKQTSYELKRLYDTSMESVHAIQNLGVDTATWDPILVHIIAEKLDADTYSSYMEARKAPRDLPIFEELMTFLESKFSALEPMNNKYKKSTTAPSTSNIQKPDIQKQESPFKFSQNNHLKGKINYTSYHVSGDRRCPLCKIDHILFHCKTFQGMMPDAKLKVIEQLHICPNCLYCHNEKPCNSRKRCKVCNGPHNTILHDLYRLRDSSAKLMPTQQNTVQATTSTSSTNHVSTPGNEVLLSTVLLKIKSIDGTYIQMRALIDQGSQISLITENAVQRLGLQRRHHSGTISGVGTSSNKSKGTVQISCESLYNDYKFTTEALVMTKVLNNLPNNTFTKQQWPHLQSIQLADPDYNISRSVDILLDASVYSDIIMDGILRGPLEAPLAQQTKIGWILFGNVKTFNCHVVLNNIDDLSRFWEMEEIANDSTSTFTAEEEYCERLYKTTTTRLPSGRYQVKIPMKQDFEQNLGVSKSQAVAQFLNLEKRMKRDPLFYSQYKNFIDEYIELGHMKLCNCAKSPSCYLPHHGVLKDSTTTQLRVVFNGSCKTQTGCSLNELMLCGPNLQQDLQAMLMRWRKYKYVYTADIEKFYRQIMVHEEDQHLQKIVWRNNEKDPLQDYQLCTVTYGTKSAAFLSMRTIKQLVQDDGHKYPLACDTLNNQLYVDDLLGGQHDINLAKQTQTQLIHSLQGGGFNLRKWASNEPSLLENPSQQQVSVSMLDFKHTQSNKTLGLRWNPQTDQFTFQQKMCREDNVTENITKRALLSDISTLYDPLGWLSPVTIKAKLIFQQVWDAGINWDDSLPDNIKREWIQFRSDMPNIEKAIIPRWLGNTSQRVELHGFCDASEKALSCVIYCKTKTKQGEVDIRLVAAKTKLAPLKKVVSIPRLELCGALLLSKLMKKVTEAFGERDITVHGWTDSMVVLGWLQGDVAKWKTFVANRVTKTVDVMPPACWKHVPSGQNPADCASRGLTPTQLINNSMWWDAPTWLKHEISHQQQTVETPKLEAKNKHTCATQDRRESNLIQELITKYSSITRLIRVTCWITRFINNIRNKANALRTNYLTAKELQKAHTAVMKTAQLDFYEDIERLCKHDTVSSKSNLLKLNPSLNADSLLCVGGRLEHSKIQKTSKHPIILPKRHKVTEMLIDQAHKMTLHAGAKLTLGYLRNKYWILGGYGRVKEQLRKCVKCIRFNPGRNNQLMADLPEPRVTPSRPFTHCGVDFTAHVEVQQLHHGKDGLVRVVTLKTKNGRTKRPIVKLAPLHVKTEPVLKTNAPSTSNPNKTPKKGNCKVSMTLAHCLLTTLLVFVTLISPSSQQSYNVTTLDATKPVFFDKLANIHIIQDEWKIIVFYNLTTYKHSLKNIERYMSNLSSMCTTEPAFVLISSQLQHEVNELKHNDKLLQLEHANRKKRGLVDGVGYLANTLFGVLDERFAEQYKQDIRHLQQNENHLKKLYQQQTSIIEGEYNVLKRNEEVMNKQYHLINKHLDNIQAAEAWQEKQHRKDMYVTIGTLSATVIISSLHRIQDSLIDMITDLRNGRVNVNLLGPAELLKQLHIITSQLPSDVSLPNFSNEQSLRNIYKVPRVHSRLTEEFLIFEVKLPLLNIDQYELHRIIPIPQKRNMSSMSIVPTSEYVAINLRKDMFITMNPNQLQTCLVIDDAHFLCPLRQPIYNIKGTKDICEAQIINNDNLTQCKTEITAAVCGDKWIKLPSGTAWLFSCCQECAVRIFCTAGVTSTSLQGTGLITLGQGCLLKHDSFTIPAHLNFKSTVFKTGEDEMKVMAPPLSEINNFISNASTRIIAPQGHAELLSELRQKIDDVKKQQEDIANDDSASLHDIHQYSLIYILISMAAAILVYKGARRIKRRCFPIHPDQNSHSTEMAIARYETRPARDETPETPSAAAQRRSTADATTSPTMTTRRY